MSALKIWDQAANTWRYLSVLAVGLDGWIDDSAETWTYASYASGKGTFTVAGDLRSKYTVGTRIKLVQSGTVAYFVVHADPTFSSGTTTVSIAGGTDYTLANSAIAAAAHSYEANPQGYPGWFNFSMAFTGFSGGTITTGAQFSVVGRVCTVAFRVSATSNATTTAGTLPIALTTGNLDWPIHGSDNGSALAQPALMECTGNGNTAVNFYKDGNYAAWTASGSKLLDGCISYRI